MPLSFNTFRDEFAATVSSAGITWEAIGFYGSDGRVYPFGTDTKVISTVFECLCAPIIEQIAARHGYVIATAEQTVYPDFTLTPAAASTSRVAIDVKTTYRRTSVAGVPQPFRYTLGSYTSFLRSPGAAKNIRFPYAEYSDHWVIGFLYTRRAGIPAKLYLTHQEHPRSLCPYMDVEYFVQEKYKIVGLSPASGNTTNIGSFAATSLAPLREGRGPFADLGKDVCDEYWRHYGTTKAARLYSTIEAFLEWKRSHS